MAQVLKKNMYKGDWGNKNIFDFPKYFYTGQKNFQMARLGYRPLLSAITIVDYGHHCHGTQRTKIEKKVHKPPLGL